MYVQTNHGIQPVNFNKILIKIATLADGLHYSLDASLVAQKTIQSMVDGISTRQLDELSAGLAANMVDKHPDYAVLAARILINRLHKNLDIPNRTFAQNVDLLYNHKINGQKSTRISEETYNFVQQNAQALESIINYQRDYDEYDYFALQGFMTRGLERIDGEIAEVPSQMFLRIAIGLNIYQPRSQEELDSFASWSGFIPKAERLKNMSNDERLAEVQRYYEMISKREISLPGPIVMHAGSKKNQMASCFLQYCSDSLTGEDYPINGKIGGIMKAVSQLGKQSQGGAGTAIAISDIRSAGSPISSSNGKSNGILPFMKMFDATIGAVNQSGKRAGVCTLYLEPWHKDILDFLDAADHFAIEEKRCKNLFYALWCNDLFFERLVTDKQEAKWTLFDPAIVKNHLPKSLTDYYGAEFKEKYLYLESLGIGQEIKLMEIWNRVMNLMQIAGLPYILNKDSFNQKTNQQNLGTVKSSNVCTEISLHSSEDETGVCVLSSVCVSRYLNDQKLDGIDYEKIIQNARLVTRHLNNVIDLQFYPTVETRNACLARRAIGVGCLGLADLFALKKLSFESPEAKIINKRIYEAIYFGCMWESMELAKQEGAYHGFEGSPVSKGEFQYDMWGLKDEDLFLSNEGSGLEMLQEFEGRPWQKLKELVKQFGVRNSEVTALAPTANNSIRMSQNEMHEPFTRLLFVRQYIGGSIQMINKYLVDELAELGLWTEEMYQRILYADGIIKDVLEIPEDIRIRYKTAYEHNFRDLIDMMADRSAFVSQSGSFNHYISYQDSGPTAFTQRIIYAWKKGLKSLSYYIHTETASTAKKELGGFSKSTAASDSSKVEKSSDALFTKENSPFIKLMRENSGQNMELDKTKVAVNLTEDDGDCEFCSS